jgi:hypothetical protein
VRFVARRATRTTQEESGYKESHRTYLLPASGVKSVGTRQWRRECSADRSTGELELEDGGRARDQGGDSVAGTAGRCLGSSCW